ncbi:hypothetical protein SLA2020_398970 [Shorea laevis]
MVLNVDLQCSKCYKKVKKILRKFPEIRDQAYDVKANKVTIKVVCCSPEKIRDKLCCKGGGCIKSIETKEPEKKPEKKQSKEPEKKKDDGKQIITIEGPQPAQITLSNWGPYGYCGRPICDCWSWGCYRCGCANYCIEENQFYAQSCKHVIACFFIFNRLDSVC